MPEGIDFDAALRLVERLTADETPPAEGMAALLEHCAAAWPSAVWAPLGALDYAAEAKRVEDWLVRIVAADPPPVGMRTWWFGLFEDSGVGGETCALYVAGSPNPWSPENLEWAVQTEESYIPRRDTLRSPALTAIYRAAAAEPDAATLADYALCLGFAALAVAAAFRALGAALLPPEADRAHVAVGFDDGDNLLLGACAASGWKPTGPRP